MGTPTYSIEIGPTGRHCRVFLDGQEVKGLTRLEITAGVNELTRFVFYQLAEATVSGSPGSVVTRHDCSDCQGHER